MKAKSDSHTTEWILAEIMQKTHSGLRISGNPLVADGKYGKSVAFNGSSDAIFLESNPLSELDEFTIEVIFMPQSGGSFEQRFLHCGETQGDRVLLELRATETHWYFDAFIAVGEEKCTLIDPDRLHPLNEWYHAAYVNDNGKLTTWISGRKEIEGDIIISPVKGSRTSIGARQNEVSWFRGIIHKIRITEKALEPDSFLKVRTIN